MKKAITLFGFIFCVFIFADGEKEKLENASKAIISVEIWLGLLDQNQYDSCYETASEYMKNASSKAGFIQNIKEVFSPLGKRISRELVSISFHKQLPDAPEGNYILLQYVTRFENKNQAVETITAMLEKEGSWKISGYYIK